MSVKQIHCRLLNAAQDNKGGRKTHANIFVKWCPFLNECGLEESTCHQAVGWS